MIGIAALGAVPIKGNLYVDGIPATFSPDLVPTVIGLWPRAAIVIDPDIRIPVARLRSQGTLEITVWLCLQALLPDIIDVLARPVMFRRFRRNTAREASEASPEVSGYSSVGSETSHAACVSALPAEMVSSISGAKVYLSLSSADDENCAPIVYVVGMGKWGSTDFESSAEWVERAYPELPLKLCIRAARLISIKSADGIAGCVNCHLVAIPSIGNLTLTCWGGSDERRKIGYSLW